MGKLSEIPIRKDRSTVALDLIDASALLWRLHLSGHEIGDRWQELAATWDQHADGRLYPFNDWHAVMAYLGADRHGEVERILSAYRRNTDDEAEPAVWARQIGLPLIEGFTEHRGRTSLSRAFHRQSFWRQPCPARHHRFDNHRSGAARRAERSGRGHGPRALGSQALQPSEPELPLPGQGKQNGEPDAD